MARMFVGDRKVARVREDYADRFLVEGPEIRPPPDGGYERVLFRSILPPRKCGSWVWHYRVAIPGGGSWLRLKRLIQHHLPPRYKMPLGQIVIWPECYEFEVRTRPLEIQGGTGVRVEQVLESSLSKSYLSGAGHGFLVRGFVRFEVAGRPCRLPAFFAVLPRLLRVKKADSPSWLWPWVQANGIGLCGECNSYFAQRAHGRFCCTACRMRAHRKKQRAASRVA